MKALDWKLKELQEKRAELVKSHGLMAGLSFKANRRDRLEDRRILQEVINLDHEIQALHTVIRIFEKVEV